MFPSSAWIFLIITCVGLGQASDSEVVQVMYRKATIKSPAGSDIQLKCITKYSMEECGWVNVTWNRVLLSSLQVERTVELKNPSKYFTTVSETMGHDNWRLRSVVTEIFSVTSDDSGVYQCLGSCEKNYTASGHMISVEVYGV